MILAGILLLILAVLLGVHIFWTLGIILLAVGLVLLLLGHFSHPIGPRNHYW